ncbi:hypothetical protein Ahy_A03g014370 [Arachis hypogaea]|uniref:FAR1 domain-containing protein n=1 Tax=Arachis hypogaea TaxID=3818 RepID=A0A445DXI2_ARAHY|nr:hypothetical protein Ahy_A03g014370 [Arachis hypogaea]
MGIHTAPAFSKRLCSTIVRHVFREFPLCLRLGASACSSTRSAGDPRLEVKESEYYSKESVRTLDPVQGLHVDGEGSDVREEGSEGFKGHEGFEAESEIHDEFGDGFYDNWEEKAINKIVDLDCMNPKKITVEVIKSVHLSDREIAFLFYNLYTKMNGFAAQRYRSRCNLNNELTQQSFGFRKERMCDGVEVADRKREPKPETRCGCEAEIHTHVDKDSDK